MNATTFLPPVQYAVGQRVRVVEADKTGKIVGILLNLGGLTEYRVRIWLDDEPREIWCHPGELEAV